jgi:hypothetical protein
LPSRRWSQGCGPIWPHGRQPRWGKRDPRCGMALPHPVSRPWTDASRTSPRAPESWTRTRPLSRDVRRCRSHRAKFIPAPASTFATRASSSAARCGSPGRARVQRPDVRANTRRRRVASAKMRRTGASRVIVSPER